MTARLETWRLVQRPLRRIGGLSAGSAASVWMLTSAGLRLLNLSAGRGAVGRIREPGHGFVRHYLAIADARVAITEASRARTFDLLELQCEPTCWRAFTGLGGEKRTLKPDLYVVTAATAYEDHWFVEIDRGTESLPTLLTQCQQYQRYHHSGQEQADGGVFPRVLWVVPDARRAAGLSQSIGSARDIRTELFRVTTPDKLIPALVEGAA